MKKLLIALHLSFYENEKERYVDENTFIVAKT